MTLGSSTTIGSIRSAPLMRAFNAIPNGSPYVPSTFSTILSASAGSSPRSSASTISCMSTPEASLATRRRWLSGKRWKPEIRDCWAIKLLSF
jgi:hypothetical protein